MDVLSDLADDSGPTYKPKKVSQRQIQKDENYASILHVSIEDLK